MKFLPSHSYGQFINNCIRLGYKPTHIERQNAIKEFLDKSWVNTYNKPIKLSKVVFPLPEAPSKEIHSPLKTSKLTPFKTGINLFSIL